MPGELSDATDNPTVKPMNSRWETQNKIHESYSIFSPNRHGPGKKSVRQAALFETNLPILFHTQSQLTTPQSGDIARARKIGGLNFRYNVTSNNIVSSYFRAHRYES
jgi:hypothetical protein